jgi:drug/metabolite transporter (DMT)-like permease
MSQSLKAHAALLVMNLIYGANYLIAKGLMVEIIRPSGFIFLRVLFTVILFRLLLAGRSMTIEKIDIGRFALCGLFGVAVNQLGFFHGLHLSNPVNAGIIMTSTPIIVMIISALLIKERVTTLKIIGIILGAAGALTLVLQNAGTGDGATMKGDMLLLMNAISYGLFLVIVKPLMKRYDPLRVAFFVFLFGLLYVTPFGLGDLRSLDLNMLNTNALIGFAYVIIGATFLTYLLNIYSLKHVNPSVVSTYVYLQPLLALFFSWLFGNYAAPEFGGGIDHLKQFSWITALCGILIISGVYLVSRSDMNESRQNRSVT